MSSQLQSISELPSADGTRDERETGNGSICYELWSESPRQKKINRTSCRMVFCSVRLRESEEVKVMK